MHGRVCVVLAGCIQGPGARIKSMASHGEVNKMYRHPAGGSAFTLVVVSVFVSALTCLAGYCAPHDRAKSAAAPVKIQAAPPLAVLNPYLQTVKSRVERYWVAAKGSKAHATVAFRINKDGRPYWVELTDAAGLESVNQSAQDAIFYSAPFPPLPAAIGDHLDLAVDFNSDYQPAVQSGYSRPIEASLSASSSLFASATAASKEGKNDVALEKLKKATILTPFDGRLRDALVAAYLAAASSKPSGEAISLMHEALLLDHQNGQARAKLNELIAASGKDPNNFDVRVAMARDYAKASQYDDAIDEYGEAWQIKNDQSLIAEINTTCERRRKYAAILKWQAILRSYDSAESHVALGQAYEACGQPAKTMEEYQKALAMNPDSRSIAAAIHELEEKTRDAATASPAAVSAPAADSGSTDSGSSLSDDFPYADFGTRSLSLRVLPDRKVAIDYLKEASPKLLTRWATNRVPLRVYVENGTGVPGYRPQFRQFMIDAFATWVKASEGRLACTIVDYPRMAISSATGYLIRLRAR